MLVQIEFRALSGLPTLNDEGRTLLLPFSNSIEASHMKTETYYVSNIENPRFPLLEFDQSSQSRIENSSDIM